jgi:hypothetical protein
MTTRAVLHVHRVPEGDAGKTPRAIAVGRRLGLVRSAEQSRCQEQEKGR